ncbi:predicted protein [Streptomyces azureus]|uniref:Lipoprotein n=1 Tax=Streptomyces azureus TaxID=146537 RepID=A0A0K8PYS4_STRAJ|nr:predicted protein [Streptomyces azureus]
MANGFQRTIPLTAFLTILLMTGACDAPNPAPPITPSSQQPTSSASDSPPDSPPDASSVLGPAPADLHDLNWADVPIPGEFCGVPGLVRLGPTGEAMATSRTWGSVRVIRTKNTLYGDTDGDHRDEAVAFVGCDDNGATQNADIAVGYVVYAHAGKNLAVLGSITPRQKSTAYHTALAGAEFAPGQIIVHEKWYRPNDAHCCPSGDATTVWTREGNRLTPGVPRITS